MSSPVPATPTNGNGRRLTESARPTPGPALSANPPATPASPSVVKLTQESIISNGIKRTRGKADGAVPAPSPAEPTKKKGRLEGPENDLEHAIAMCLHTERERRKAESLPLLTEHDQVVFKQGFTKLFTDKANITFEKIVAAASMLRLIARDSEVDEEHLHYVAAMFTAHCTRVRIELGNINQYVQYRKTLDAKDLELLSGSIARLHEYLMHDTTWYGIMPFLGLDHHALARARTLMGTSVTLNDKSELVAKLHDIETRLRPDSTLNIAPHPLSLRHNKEHGLRQSLAKTEKAHKDTLKDKDRTISDLESRLMQEQQTQKELAADLERKKLAMKYKEGAYNQLQQSHKEKMKELAEANDRELAARKEKHQADVAAVKAKHEEQMKHLNERMEKELEAQWQRKLDKDATVRRQAEEEKRQASKAADAAATKLAQENESKCLAKREELNERLKQYQNVIQSITDRLRDGTPASVDEGNFLSTLICLENLSNIWKLQSTTIIDMKPHTLWNDRDLALEFEVDTLAKAHLCMMTLVHRKCDANELLATNWNHAAMLRLQHGLEPYHENSALSSLSRTVVAICNILEQALIERHTVQITGAAVSHGDNLAASFGSSTNTQPSIFSQNLGSSIGTQATNATASLAPSFQAAPHLDTNANSALAMPSSGGFLQPSTGLKSAPPILPQTGLVDDTMSVDGEAYKTELANMAQRQQAYSTSLGNVSSEIPRGSQSNAQPCHNFARTGNCRFGASCRFSHVPQVLQQVQVASTADPRHQRPACRRLVEGNFCRNGPRCKFSHDEQVIQQARLDRAQTQCPNVARWNWCSTQDCAYLHGRGEHANTGRVANGPRNRFDSPGATQPESIIPTPVADRRATQQCHYEARDGRCPRSHCAFLHTRRPTTREPSVNNTAAATATDPFPGHSFTPASPSFAPERNPGYDRGFSNSPPPSGPRGVANRGRARGGRGNMNATPRYAGIQRTSVGNEGGYNNLRAEAMLHALRMSRSASPAPESNQRPNLDRSLDDMIVDRRRRGGARSGGRGRGGRDGGRGGHRRNGGFGGNGGGNDAGYEADIHL
ncbi:hypothetical protein FB567DRAFT_553546 [Paraphoma chrysanthemicola]|uniref:C3H1-type domain-containing protein n=1 Tax=Paraphoma chrysanthemicola TaxID=798071 RepID=A0A8K0VT04_9PLEO|nr:hypothetical protein FB567DRAFT_553546 [Paraphoma chrysanthemicola]